MNKIVYLNILSSVWLYVIRLGGTAAGLEKHQNNILLFLCYFFYCYVYTLMVMMMAQKRACTQIRASLETSNGNGSKEDCYSN